MTAMTGRELIEKLAFCFGGYGQFRDETISEALMGLAYNGGIVYRD